MQGRVCGCGFEVGGKEEEGAGWRNLGGGVEAVGWVGCCHSY